MLITVNPWIIQSARGSNLNFNALAICAQSAKRFERDRREREKLGDHPHLLNAMRYYRYDFVWPLRVGDSFAY